MEDEDKAPLLLTGRVKWFDPSKGFGFIVANEGGDDVLLHANVLRNFGQSSVADGASIMARVQRTARGQQAVEVLEITPPPTVLHTLAEGDPIEDFSHLTLQPARVKWFDKDKGFGFANVFGQPADVFVHVEVLRQSGFADLQAGEAVCLRITEGKRGKMAVQVVSWDGALRQD